jgi:hypothetical protein
MIDDPNTSNEKEEETVEEIFGENNDEDEDEDAQIGNICIKDRFALS